MSRTIALFLFSLPSLLSSAQEAKFSFGVSAGISHFLPRSGPDNFSEDITMKFARPVRKMFGASFDYFPTRNLYLGLIATYQEFDWGYIPVVPQTFQNFSSGLLGSANSRPSVSRVGVSIGRRLDFGHGIGLIGSIGPSLGYAKIREYTSDTTYFNKMYRDGEEEAYAGVTFEYFTYRRQNIQYQGGLHLLLNAQLELRADFGHHAIGWSVGYQQGFRPFLTDSMQVIKVYRSNREGKVFYTAINGRSLPFQIHYRYRFYRRQKNSTKYREIPPGGGF